MTGLRSLVVGLCILAASAATLACDEAPEPEPMVKPAVSTEKGRALYGGYGCAACHGLTGSGNGPLARSLPVKPRNLSSPASYRNGSDAASVAKTIAEGLMTKGLGMPPYPHIPEPERREIATYLLSLQRQ